MSDFTYRLFRRRRIDGIKQKKPRERGFFERIFPNNKAIADSRMTGQELKTKEQRHNAQQFFERSEIGRGEGHTHSENVAFTLPENSSEEDAVAAVGRYLEAQAADVVVDDVEELQLAADVGEKEAELKQMEPLVKVELGRRDAMVAHAARRSPSLSAAARAALVPTSLLEVVVLHPSFAAWFRHNKILRSGLAGWGGTALFVLVANILLFVTVKLAATWGESVRMADRIGDEPPEKSRLLVIQLIGLFALAFQVVLAFVRIQGAKTETVDATGVLVSVLVVLATYTLAGIEFLSCSLPPFWDERLLTRFRRLWEEIHLDLRPALSRVQCGNQDVRLSGLKAIASKLDHRFGALARTYISRREVVKPYEPPTFSWPKPTPFRPARRNAGRTKAVRGDKVIRFRAAGD